MLPWLSRAKAPQYSEAGEAGRRPCYPHTWTAGGATVGTNDYPTLLSAALNVANTTWNKGVGGTSIGTSAPGTGFLARQQSDLGSTLTSLGSSNIIVFLGMVNDAYYGDSASTIWSNIVTYLGRVPQYAPPGTHVFVCTMWNRANSQTPPINSVLQAVDAMILDAANVAAHGYTPIDLAGNPELDPNLHPENFGDGVLHPNPTGNAIMVSMIAPYVNAVIR